MKKIIYLLQIVLVLLTSCDSILEVDNLTQKRYLKLSKFAQRRRVRISRLLFDIALRITLAEVFLSGGITF